MEPSWNDFGGFWIQLGTKFPPKSIKHRSKNAVEKVSENCFQKGHAKSCRAKNVSDKKVLEGQALNAMELSSWGIFFVVFFAILREGFETAIFLISSFSITGTFSYLGFFSGAVLAILIGYLIVAQGRKVDLKSVFKYTTLLLVFLSAGMIAYGTHEAEEYLVKSGQMEKSEIYRVWNVLEPTEVTPGAGKTSHILHDKGTIGVFLKGFFGYNSNPNIIEVVLWVLALMFGLNMWRRFYY